MSCEEIKKLIPAYIKHTAPDEEIKKVEEHLCVCNICREYLGKFMDKEETNISSKNLQGNLRNSENPAQNDDMKIISEAQIIEEDIPLVSDEENLNKEQETKIEASQKDFQKEKKNKKIGGIEYFVLVIGICVLIFLIRLLTKG